MITQKTLPECPSNDATTLAQILSNGLLAFMLLELKNSCKYQLGTWVLTSYNI